MAETSEKPKTFTELRALVNEFMPYAALEEKEGGDLEDAREFIIYTGLRVGIDEHGDPVDEETLTNIGELVQVLEAPDAE